MQLCEICGKEIIYKYDYEGNSYKFDAKEIEFIETKSIVFRTLKKGHIPHICEVKNEERKETTQKERDKNQ